jgi:glycosyltransferase involved in cell wall biosynthesis
MYPIWMLMVFLRVLTLGRRRVLFCLGWESAFPALLASKLTGSTVIFDDADRFSMLVKLPGPLHRILVRLEEWTSRNSAVHLIPGWSRYDFRHGRMKLLRNTPTSSDFHAAKAAPAERPDADIVLYVNGWIGETRGAPIFLELMQRFLAKGTHVVLIAAGWTDCDAGRTLFKMPNVRFMGELSTEQALALYPACDAVLTYYDPAVPINRQAESNKWGDAIFLGRPFIVNSEVETAAPLVAQGFGFAVPYHDIDALVELVDRLPAIARERNFDDVVPPDDFLPFERAIQSVLTDVLQPGARFRYTA